MKRTIYYIVLLFVATGCQERHSVSVPADARDRQVASDAFAQSAEADSAEADSAKASEAIGEEHQPQDVRGQRQHAGHGARFGAGRGRGKGRGMGIRGGEMSGRRADMTTIHALFADQDKIKRTVRILPDGAEAITESDDEAIAGLLQEHVPAMEDRILENAPLPPMTFHPIFVELIKHSDDYTLDYESTNDGMKVTYHAEDPFVVMLVQEHAKLVSRFIKNGMSEIHKPYTLPDIAGERRAPRTVALAAKDELFTRLSGRLTEVINSKGLAAAIQVCSQEASVIAKTVADEHHVKIGRTAIKLRNPLNKPPEWVKPLIKEELAEPQYVELADGHTGALFPIKLHAKCMACHGPIDSISDEIKSQLTRLYPQDQATGFSEGDLRGWFWVDVPASPDANR